MTSRFGNWSLNAGLVVAVLVAGLLLYALIDRAGSPRPDPRRHENPGNLLGDIIQVEVLNACGVPGVARDVTMHLRALGFDVVETGNFSRLDVESSSVVDRTGNMDAARQVALALGIEADDVESEVSPDHYLDATVIIGLDYQNIAPFKEQN